MIFSYFPGCTLKTKAKELDRWGRAVRGGPGLHPGGAARVAVLRRGVSHGPGRDRLAAVGGPGPGRRPGPGPDLVTLCSACHHVIKRVNGDMPHDATSATRPTPICSWRRPTAGETQVLHYLEVLRDCVGFEPLKAQVVHPLTGRKIGAYYGCLLLRPGSGDGL